MLIRELDNVKTVEWGNGVSRRFLLEADGMGYTMTDTIVRAGTRSLIEYENHLEACYCIEGKGSVVEMDGTEHPITPGVMYALDKRDTHWLVGSDDEDLRLVCTFSPALVGDEAHTFGVSGIHPSVYGASQPRSETRTLLRREDVTDRRDG